LAALEDFNLDEAADGMVADMMPLWSELLEVSGDEAIAALGVEVDVDWSQSNPHVSRVLDRLATRIRGVADTTRDDVRRLVEQGNEDGLTVRQIADFIRERAPEISKSRSQLIARTESATGANLGAVIAYRAAGIDRVKVLDGDGDPECAAADGQIWTLEEADANPIAHPGCVRAFAPYVTDDDERVSTPVGDALAATRRYEEDYGDYHIELLTRGGDIGAGDFDADLEMGRIRATLDHVREVVQQSGGMVQTVDEDGDLMVKHADRKVGVQVVFTADKDSAGRGVGSLGAAKVFYAPYSHRDKLGHTFYQASDPVYVLTHELHHAFGSSSEFDTFSDITSAAFHLRQDTQEVRGDVEGVVRSSLGWALSRAGGEHTDSIERNRAALGWLYGQQPEAVEKLVRDNFGDADAVIKKVKRWSR
jgi:hypothetical protein